jgi:hypothetical protein
LLSNGSEITFPLQRIATDEPLPGIKLLNTKYFVRCDEGIVSIKVGEIGKARNLPVPLHSNGQHRITE